eukprot:CAMPEP_0195510038 /NCGR_PEP_ID=MMETSP0794_2-20130614/2798_1 /TAXON_ID=515487 /ORGANISM="Stephanopyxis turris, Strain CCMP 815" /LENGTH=284 /DNA_ID=CAMNT_0040637387 /DNA_START=167 /DNA_END=1021 /DNA_ORIENTATION=-
MGILSSTNSKATISDYSVGKPSFAVVPAGHCQFGEEWTSVALNKVDQISEDTKVFTFKTPDTSKPLNLPTCACILARAGKDTEGNPFIRPYTPVSSNSMIGEFELMVKIYPDGNLSQHMDRMKVGDKMDFKHIKFNVKRQYPFGVKHIAMLVGGTGITPMVQALHAVLGNADDATKVTMLYGSQKSDQILCEKVLADWAEEFPDQLSVTHVLSQEPEDSAWTGERGFINEKLIKEHFPAPGSDVSIFVCGPPPMYNALCGARGEEEVSGVLAELGYSKEEVTKF